MQLLVTKDNVQQQLREIHEKLRKLSEILGDPKVFKNVLNRTLISYKIKIPSYRS